MTSRTQVANLDLEANEGKLRCLRAEAQQRLEAVTTNSEEIVAVCRLIFEILSIQDKEQPGS
jgi:hypothetical protein